MAAPEPPPLPVLSPGLEEVRERLWRARAAAVDLLREAEELEERARVTRRKARARMKRYEDLLAEHQGQLSMLDEEGVF